MDITSSTYVSIILFIVSLCFCAIFSFLETSITALRLFKLKELAQRATKYQQLFYSLEHTPNQLLNIILVANSLANTTAATAGTFLCDSFLHLLPPGINYCLSVLLVSFTLLVVGEIIPKNIAKVHGENLLPSTLWITNLLFFLLRPFVTGLVQILNRLIYYITGSLPKESGFVTSEKEIQFLINYIEQHGLMDPEKTSMLRSIFTISKITVKDILIPFNSVIALDASSSIEEAFSCFARYHYSRIPVYEDNPHNIIGVVYFKEIVPALTQKKNSPVKDLIQPILFVSEHIRVNELLKKFRQQHMHVAMVINEHEITTGLVSLEDVLEEIVGDIHDEHDNANNHKTCSISPQSWLIWGDTDLYKLAATLKINFVTKNAHTLADFLIEQFQCIPQEGDRLVYKNYTFEIKESDKETIKKVVLSSLNSLKKK